MFLDKIIGFIRRFWTKYLNQAQDRETESVIVENIIAGTEFKGSSIWILIFAIFIASLGLNTNSTAVIIGAMLISPLMGPIMGVGLGLGINDFDLIKKSFRNLAVATLFSIFASTLYFLISPLNEARSELLARTSPTIYDVLIALFGGLAGIVGMSTKQKGNVIPGVAIATALMPPLCTAGFGLANGNMHYFFGAFYLYFINSVFIAFATTIGVKAMKFSKKQFVDKEKEKKVQRIVYSILIITMTPSIVITYNMVRQNYFESAAYQFITEQLNFPNTTILNKTVKLSGKNKEISVTLLGKEVPKDSLLVAEARLPNYGLKGTKLFVDQGYGQGSQLNVKDISGEMFQEVYKDNQMRISFLDTQIDSLENVINSYRQYDTISRTLTPEIKVLFPNIDDIAISRTTFNTISTNKLDTFTLAIVKHRTAINQGELQKFQSWLEARLGTKNIKVIQD